MLYIKLEIEDALMCNYNSKYKVLKFIDYPRIKTSDQEKIRHIDGKKVKFISSMSLKIC